jgi:hypothetical protein
VTGERGRDWRNYIIRGFMISAVRYRGGGTDGMVGKGRGVVCGMVRG